MTAEKLFNTLKGSYHDASLLDALYQENVLYLHCFRNPPDPENKEDPNYRYVMIRFDGVTDLEVWDWEDTESFIPYKEELFDKERIFGDEAWALNGIYGLELQNDRVVFIDSLRFRCTDATLLAHSCDEIDFQNVINTQRGCNRKADTVE